MVRFIFVCMAITALSLLSIAAQPLIDGISQTQQTLAQRNIEDSALPFPSNTPDDAAMETAMTPDALNNIDTAAGGFSSEDDGNFGTGFSNSAPAALPE